MLSCCLVVNWMWDNKINYFDTYSFIILIYMLYVLVLTLARRGAQNVVRLSVKACIILYETLCPSLLYDSSNVHHFEYHYHFPIKYSIIHNSYKIEAQASHGYTRKKNTKESLRRAWRRESKGKLKIELDKAAIRLQKALRKK